MAVSPDSIMLVSSDRVTLDVLKDNLETVGYVIYCTQFGLSAIELAKKNVPGLIILDIAIEDMDGVELCQRIREIKKLDTSIILFYSERSEDYTRIAAFEAGADDFVRSPVKFGVFKHRIKALLRRIRTVIEPEVEMINIGEFVIDNSKIEVRKNNKIITLVKKEFQLFQLLASDPGKVYSREEIFHKIWDKDIIVGHRTIDVHIRKLREKIGKGYITTIKGIGYKFELVS